MHENVPKWNKIVTISQNALDSAFLTRGLRARAHRSICPLPACVVFARHACYGHSHPVVRVSEISEAIRKLSIKLKIVLKKSMLVEEFDLKATAATIKKCIERHNLLIQHVYLAVDM